MGTAMTEPLLSSPSVWETGLESTPKERTSDGNWQEHNLPLVR